MDEKGLEHATQKFGESFALYLYFEGFLWGYRLLDLLRFRNKGWVNQDAVNRIASTKCCNNRGPEVA